MVIIPTDLTEEEEDELLLKILNLSKKNRFVTEPVPCGCMIYTFIQPSQAQALSYSKEHVRGRQQSGLHP